MNSSRMQSYTFFYSLAAFCAVVIAKLFYDRLEIRRVDAVWARAAQDLGLAFRCTTWANERRITGVLRDFAVVLAPKRMHKTMGTRLVVSGGGRIEHSLLLYAEGYGTGLMKKLIGEDVQTGDASFDRRVYVQGPEARVLALLNPQARKAVLEFLKHGDGVVKNGNLEFAVRGMLDKSDSIVTLIEAAVNAAAQLVLAENNIVEEGAG